MLLQLEDRLSQILIPRAFASALRATAHPSLFEATTTGRPTSEGSNTVSQAAYIAFTSHRANICFISECMHDGCYDTENFEFIFIAKRDVRVIVALRSEDRFAGDAQI